MRAFVITPVFPPEPIISAQTSIQLAEELTAQGHDVTVITAFPNRPAGKLYPGYRRAFYRHEHSEDGYDILRCFSVISSESSLLSRFAENMSFGLTSSWWVLWHRKPNVIYANTWPIFAAGILVLTACLRRVPLVISVQDLYPESLVSQGRLSAQSPVTRLLRNIDRAIAGYSQKVIVISEQFAQIYREDRQVPAQNVHVVPNWVDERQILPDEGGLELRAEMGIGEKEFLFVYGGNVGAAAGVEGVIQALGQLPDKFRPHLLIAGAGSRLDNCRTLAKTIAPENITFFTPWPTEKTSSVYAAANVLILPTQGTQSLVSVPSKLITYMLSARPIIAQALSNSDLSKIIHETGCGWVVEPDQPDLLANAILDAMRLSPEELRQRGQAGRKYALQRLTRSACLPRIIGILEEAVNVRK